MANAYVQNLRVSPFVEPFDLKLADGEAVAILGPTSTGKTRLLRAVAGLDRTAHGSIAIGSTPVEGLPAAERGIAMVFQQLTLYPHLDVEGNMSFPMECAGVGGAERRARIDDLATQLDLVTVLDRKPPELTAPQRLRAALARALAKSPRLLLVDDGLDRLSSVDRQEMRSLLRNVQRSLRLTTIYATRDFVDAMSLADRIAFVAGGRLQQVDTPAILYDNPATTAVARGLGSPTINLIDATCHGASLRLDDDQTIELPEAIPSQNGSRGVLVGVRPEKFVATADRKNSVLAILDPTSRQSLGSHSVVAGQVGSTRVFVQVEGNPKDFPRRAYAAPSNLLIFDRESGARIR